MSRTLVLNNALNRVSMSHAWESDLINFLIFSRSHGPRWGCLLGSSASASSGFGLSRSARLRARRSGRGERYRYNLTITKRGAEWSDLGDVRKGVNDAIVVTTCAGLWAHIIGDTIRFERLDPPLLTFTGRTRYALSVFVEHLILQKVASAVARAWEWGGAAMLKHRHVQERLSHGG